MSCARRSRSRRARAAATAIVTLRDRLACGTFLLLRRPDFGCRPADLGPLGLRLAGAFFIDLPTALDGLRPERLRRERRADRARRDRLAERRRRTRRIDRRRRERRGPGLEERRRSRCWGCLRWTFLPWFFLGGARFAGRVCALRFGAGWRAGAAASFLLGDDGFAGWLDL